MDYKAYLSTPHWRSFRLRIIIQRGHQCEFCLRKPKKIHLHHKTYKRIGREKPWDVVLLCRKCHELVHKVHKSPRFKGSLWKATEMTRKFWKKKLAGKTKN